MKTPFSKTKKAPAHQPEEYRHCQAWNEAIGLQAYVLRREIKMCSEGDAPLDAVFQRPDGTWFLFKEITDPHMITEMTEVFAKNNWGTP